MRGDLRVIVETDASWTSSGAPVPPSRVILP
jgi:hypothetical protein